MDGGWGTEAKDEGKGDESYFFKTNRNSDIVSPAERSTQYRINNQT